MSVKNTNYPTELGMSMMIAIIWWHFVGLITEVTNFSNWCWSKCQGLRYRNKNWAVLVECQGLRYRNKNWIILVECQGLRYRNKNWAILVECQGQRYRNKNWAVLVEYGRCQTVDSSTNPKKVKLFGETAFQWPHHMLYKHLTLEKVAKVIKHCCRKKNEFHKVDLKLRIIGRWQFSSTLVTWSFYINLFCYFYYCHHLFSCCVCIDVFVSFSFCVNICCWVAKIMKKNNLYVGKNSWCSRFT